ncbi:hydrolase, partial [Vibrio cholerae]|nr:hydrolase [Vibrio cholerae]
PTEAVAEPSVISPHLSDEPVLPSVENMPSEVVAESLSSATEAELELQESEPAISEPTLEAPLVAQPEDSVPQ